VREHELERRQIFARASVQRRVQHLAEEVQLIRPKLADVHRRA
jgi:hypothetical protein